MARKHAALRQPGVRDADHPYAAIGFVRTPGVAGPRVALDAPAVATGDGLSWALLPRSPAQVWGTPGAYDLDMAHRWYLVITRGDPQIYAIRQQDIAAVEGAQDLYRLAYLTDQDPALLPIYAGVQSCRPGLDINFDGTFGRAYDNQSVFIGLAVGCGATVGPAIVFPSQIVLFPAGFAGGTLAITVQPSGVVALTAVGSAPRGVAIGTIVAAPRANDYWNDGSGSFGYTHYSPGNVPPQTRLPTTVTGPIGPATDLRLITTPLGGFFAWTARWQNGYPGGDDQRAFPAGATGILYGPGGASSGGHDMNGIQTQGLAPVPASPSWANRWCVQALGVTSGEGENTYHGDILRYRTTTGTFTPTSSTYATISGPGLTHILASGELVQDPDRVYGRSQDPDPTHLSGRYSGTGQPSSVAGETYPALADGTFTVVLVYGTCPHALGGFIVAPTSATALPAGKALLDPITGVRLSAPAPMLVRLPGGTTIAVPPQDVYLSHAPTFEAFGSVSYLLWAGLDGALRAIPQTATPPPGGALLCGLYLSSRGGAGNMNTLDVGSYFMSV